MADASASESEESPQSASAADESEVAAASESSPQVIGPKIPDGFQLVPRKKAAIDIALLKRNNPQLVLFKFPPNVRLLLRFVDR